MFVKCARKGRLSRNARKNTRIACLFITRAHAHGKEPFYCCIPIRHQTMSFAETFTNMLLGDDAGDIKRQIRRKRAEIRTHERHIQREIQRFEDEERDLQREAVKLGTKGDYVNALNVAKQIDLNRRQKAQMCNAMHQLKNISNDLRNMNNQHTLQTSISTVTEILRELNSGSSVDGVRSLRDFQYQREVSESRREHLDDIMNDALDDDSMDVDAEENARGILANLGVAVPRDVYDSNNNISAESRYGGSQSSASASSSSEYDSRVLISAHGDNDRSGAAPSSQRGSGNRAAAAAANTRYEFEDPSLNALAQRLKNLRR